MTIRCKARDTVLNCHTKESVQSLKEKFLALFDEFKGQNDDDVRLFIGARELKPLEEEIGRFITEDCILLGFPVFV